MRVSREVDIPYFAQGLQRYGSLDRLVNAHIDMLEGITRHLKVLLRGAVYNGTQVAHIERCGVAAESAIAEELLEAGD